MTGFIASQRTVNSSESSEGDDAREILVHQTLEFGRESLPQGGGHLVVRLQGLNVRHLGALCVEVELIELLHPLHHLLILWLGEVVVVPSSVPRVARVKPESMMGVLEAPDRPQASLGNGGSHFCHVVHQHLQNVNFSKSLTLCLKSSRDKGIRRGPSSSSHSQCHSLLCRCLACCCTWSFK